jgi:hypothetical protein
MEIILICILIASALFVSAFMARRRFGLLGLALAAGSLLSGIWAFDVGLIVGAFGISAGPISSAVISALIILLPAGVLLFHGYTYKTLVGRVVGASLFTLLAFAFLIEPLGHILVLQGDGANIYNWLVNNRTFIIGAGLIAAVVDLFLTKPVWQPKKKHEH